MADALQQQNRKLLDALAEDDDSGKDSEGIASGMLRPRASALYSLEKQHCSSDKIDTVFTCAVIVDMEVGFGRDRQKTTLILMNKKTAGLSLSDKYPPSVIHFVPLDPETDRSPVGLSLTLSVARCCDGSCSKNITAAYSRPPSAPDLLRRSVVEPHSAHREKMRLAPPKPLAVSG